MIGRLRGILLEKQPPDILLEVNDIGYEVSMPINCFYELPNIGEVVNIYTHFLVRENAQLLYGFNTTVERALFRAVIKTNGVGPKLGLAILSGMTVPQFIDSIERADLSTLVKIHGVGKKTAKRLMIEMPDRLKNWANFNLLTWHANVAAQCVNSKNAIMTASTNPKDEAMGTLIALGYKAMQAEKVVK
ncbi:Holliday junction branch migration protein RuvA [Candidatus Enterovibrio altilux]|uniref:Holliday junction branch migration protein RuvA n=1 Tax=Candidatus Enterovibrio altilux TaxID=1927128 RepID=UPI000BBCD815